MTGLQEVEWEECFLEPRKDAELEREVRKSFGLVSPATRFLTHCPWLLRAFARNNFRNGMLVHIDVSLGGSITAPWPALTMVLAVVFLGETIAPYQVGAVAVVIVAIWGLTWAGLAKARRALA